MEKIEKLMNLIENKYGKKSITEGSKEKIREIVREEIARVVESLEEVDESNDPMTFKSLEKVMNKWMLMVGCWRNEISQKII